MCGVCSIVEDPAVAILPVGQGVQLEGGSRSQVQSAWCVHLQGLGLERSQTLLGVFKSVRGTQMAVAAGGHLHRNKNGGRAA